MTLYRLIFYTVRPKFINFTSHSIDLTYLIFVQLTVLIFLFALTLEGNDNKTYEDVDHEECNDDDENEKENCHRRPVVMDRTDVLSVGVNGLVHQTGKHKITLSV